MFKYRDNVRLNQKFNKSVNIIYDVEDCSQYILTTSALNVLKNLFNEKSNNSISIIGPFGCGKSSLLLYINTLLSDSEYIQKCLDKLLLADQTVYKQFIDYRENKKFFRIKIVGEHISFKTQLKSSLLSINGLKKTVKYLKDNEQYQVSKLLDILSKEVKKLGYADVLFSIDEFGKFIEYSLEEKDTNDIFELQTVAEFINTQKKWKLIVSLHKTFREYNNIDSMSITYTDWDKIQGRFENVIFNDDFFEMLNIFKETIIVDEKADQIKEAKKIIDEICSDESFTKQISTKDTLNIFEHICPIHPYSVLVIAEIFTKYFQNQRSIYSFLFSSEAHAFQEFLDKDLTKFELYDLTNLYDYVSYLLKIYTILLPDKEIWYLSEYRLKDNRVENDIQKDIIKTIGLLHTFKLNLIVIPNIEHIILSLSDKYKEEKIRENFLYLEENNIIVFQEQIRSYSLLEDSNIDINKEMKNLLYQNTNIDYEVKINQLISKNEIVAKRFFSKYGLEKTFKKIYVVKNTNVLKESYKIFLISNYSNEIKNNISKNENSIFILIKNHNKLEEFVKKIEILKYIREKNLEKISKDTNEIINNMILDYVHTFESLLNKDIEESKIHYQNIEYSFSSRKLQELLSDISEKNFSETPIINNYTLNYTINNKGTNTTIIKSLFKKMIGDFDKEDLAFEKYPAEKALFLSVVKPAGIHRKIDGVYQLSEPNSLNFEYVWNAIKNFIKNRSSLTALIKYLSEEPFGLNETKALFVISLFLLVNKGLVSIFKEKSYVFEFSIDILMNMWKAIDKYELELIELSKKEQDLFKAYLEITNELTEYGYSAEKVNFILKTIYDKFETLPKYTHQTQKLSKEAINLRAALVSIREPRIAFFKLFPEALGYDKIDDINNQEFVRKFKSAFNEIVLSYKEIIFELEECIATLFLFKTKKFPFDNSLIEISNKLSKIDILDSNSKAIIRCFTYSNSIIEFIDSLCTILIRKKIVQCYDYDIESFKEKLIEYAEKLLSKLELKDFAKENQDTRKLSLISLDKSLNKVISIDKGEIDKIDKKVVEIKKLIPNEYTNEQKLYLISQLLNKELNNE